MRRRKERARETLGGRMKSRAEQFVRDRDERIKRRERARQECAEGKRRVAVGVRADVETGMERARAKERMDEQHRREAHAKARRERSAHADMEREREETKANVRCRLRAEWENALAHRNEMLVSDLF